MNEPRWSVFDFIGFDLTTGKIFDGETIGILDEEAGGIVGYFNDRQLAQEFVDFKNDQENRGRR